MSDIKEIHYMAGGLMGFLQDCFFTLQSKTIGNENEE